MIEHVSQMPNSDRPPGLQIKSEGGVPGQMIGFMPAVATEHRVALVVNGWNKQSDSQMTVAVSLEPDEFADYCKQMVALIRDGGSIDGGRR